MDKTKKWRKILAMMLTIVMMLQNVQSVIVTAGVTNEEIEARLNGQTQQTQEQQPSQSQVETRANGETYQTQQQQEQQEAQTSQEQQTQNDGSDNAVGVDISDGNGNVGAAGDGQTESTQVSNANVSAVITQSIFQEEISGGTYNFAQMTAQITNNDTENAATGVSVTALLPAQLSYINGYGKETSGIIAYAAPYQAQASGYDLSQIPSTTLDTYANNQIILWNDQTIGAGETAEYDFVVQIQDGVTDVAGVDTAWYVNATACNYNWENTELLAPAPEVTETPEETPEPEVTETPEETPAPEVTEAPEETPEPEVTEAPEETPAPEVTETPEETPEPEVTETPEKIATPTPTTSEDKKAKLEEQDKLLNQTEDRLNIKKSSKASKKDDKVVTYSTLSSLRDFIYDAEIVPDTGRGDDGEPTADNGSCRISLKFKEDPSEGGNQFAKTLTYELPEGITVYETITGQIDGINDLDGAVLGTYTITPPAVSGGKATMTVTFNDTIKGEAFENYKNLDCTVEFNSWFKIDTTSGGNKRDFIFSDTVTKEITFKPGKQFSGNKRASTYIKGDGNTPGYFEFTIDLRSDSDISAGESFTVKDILGDNLSLYGDIKYSIGGQTYTVGSDTTPAKIDSKTENSFDMTITGPVSANQLMTVTYKATIKDITLLYNFFIKKYRTGLSDV